MTDLKQKLLKKWQTVAESSDEDLFIARMGEILVQQREALEFYANGRSWREHNPSNRPSGMTYKQRITSRDSSEIGPNKYDFGGGKRARSCCAATDEALKKMGVEVV
jgi:hypothetical protein